jgi:hypothetical protein
VGIDRNLIVIGPAAGARLPILLPTCSSGRQGHDNAVVIAVAAAHVAEVNLPIVDLL